MVRNDHGDRTYSEAEMTPNPMRSEVAAPAQDLSLLSDAVVNELLREKGLSLDARIEFLCKRVAAPPVPQNAWHILDFVPLVNVLRAVFFKRVPAPDQVKDKMNMLCLVSALMLSASLEVSLAIQADDFDAILDRFAHEPYSNCHVDGPRRAASFLAVFSAAGTSVRAGRCSWGFRKET